jgi:hypothetical protein
VLVRVTWDPRRPITGDSERSAPAHGDSRAMPEYGAGAERSTAPRSAAPSNVVAAPARVRTCPGPLAAALAGVRAPEDLGLVVIARPHTLLDEIGVFPTAARRCRSWRSDAVSTPSRVKRDRPTTGWFRGRGRPGRRGARIGVDPEALLTPPRHAAAPAACGSWQPVNSRG